MNSNNIKKYDTTNNRNNIWQSNRIINNNNNDNIGSNTKTNQNKAKTKR